MRHLFSVLALTVATAQVGASPALSPSAALSHVSPDVTTPASFNFQFAQVAQVLQVVYGEALKTSFVLAPDVLTDQRLVSFRYDASNGSLRPFLAHFLDSLGMQMQTRDGVDFVSVRPKPDDRQVEEDRDVIVYRPKYRSVSYLNTMLRPLFPRGLTQNRNVAAPDSLKVGSVVNPPASSAAALVDQNSDALVFAGSYKDAGMLRQLLPQLDVPVGEVVVRAVAYEVATTKDQGSAFQLALNLLGGKLSMTLGPAGLLTNAVKFSNNTIDAVLSALSEDSRFSVLNSPNLRLTSGRPGRLVVGQKVPVLSAVSYPQGAGQAVQSVEYQSAGVIFEVTPTVKESAIEVTVMQQISDFVKTTTGVNSSPTLNTREVTSSVTLADGEMIMLGGLRMNKNTRSRSGMSFLPRILDSTVDSSSESEILLVLQVQRL